MFEQSRVAYAILFFAGVSFGAEPAPEMKAYTQTIPGTDVKFDMVPIPAGKVTMGSPENEKGHHPDEGPQFEVQVEAMWVGKTEVTWAEYEQYMKAYKVLKALEPQRPVTDANRADAVTAPTPLYDPSYVEDKGHAPRQSASTMTQYAARQYTKWLSKFTGEFYRLPTEAEWEYFARAGTKTAYFFGDDPAKMDDYAWFSANSTSTLGKEEGLTYHPVGLKKPNPWGLYDIYGNVREWTLDQYIAEGYAKFGGKSVKWGEAVAWPTELDPRVLRGGSFRSSLNELRSAARAKSDHKEWRSTDPQGPKSPWWLAQNPDEMGDKDRGGQEVGIRLVRPVRVPPKEEWARYWDADVEVVRKAVHDRIAGHDRGVEGIVGPELPELMKKLEAGGGK